MIGGKGSTIVFYAALAMFGAFYAVWLLDFAVVRSNWCADVETTCLREWVGALSGWVAAAAAAATIGVLYKQLAEQRKQTEFTLGDGLPTVDAMEDEDEMCSIVLRVVNWNRRALLIQSIEATGQPKLCLELRDALVEGREIQNLYVDSTVFQPPMLVPGWVDRSKAPATAKIKFRATTAERTDSRSITPTLATLTVHASLLGETHRSHDFVSSTVFNTI